MAESKEAVGAVQRIPARRDVWGRAALIGALAALATVVAWIAAVREQHAQALRTTEAHASRLADALTAGVEAEFETLANLQAFWSRFALQPQEGWQADAGIVLENHPALASLAWVHPQRGSAWIASASDAEPIDPDDPVTAARLDEAARAVLGAPRFVGSPFPTPAGIRVLVALPVAGGRAGALVAALRPDVIARRAVAGRAFRYAVRVSWGDLELFRSAEPGAPEGRDWWHREQEVPIRPLAARWRLRVEPTAARVAADLTPVPTVVLLAGIAITLLLAASGAAFQLAQRRARALQVANHDLVNETGRYRLAENEVRSLNRELSTRVAERTAELAEAVGELEAFNYSVSHDLRSPLGAIVNMASILEEDCGEALRSAGGGDYVERIRSSAMNALGMMERLLEFSQIGRQKLEPVQVDMGDLARRVVDEIRSARTDGDRFKVEIGELPPARADETTMRLVLSNLISNAFKFSASREEPRVQLEAHEKGGRWVYSVRDNGVGFDPRFSNKLFQVFERLHPSEDFEGHGVGLAIVNRIVRRHGGSVWVEAEKGRGATFSFTLEAA